MRSGAFLMEQLDEPVRAIAVYHTIREDDPDHLEALDRLARLFRSQEMAAELADILRCQIDVHHTPEQKIALLADLAAVKEQQLSDAIGAHEAHLEVLDLDQGNDPAIQSLHRLATEGVQRLEIAERLEPIYAARADWSTLHDLLELKLGAVSDDADRMELCRQLAELNLRQLDRKPEAIEWYGRALCLDPDDTNLSDQLDSLAVETAL